MNYVNLPKDQCCGCGACANICPNNAIKMKADAEGFLYPIVQTNLCIDCGLCRKVCSAYQSQPISQFKQEYYAVQHKDENIVLQSSSGGFFTALADTILQYNGIVYGAVYDERFRVQHDRAININEIKRFRGSKYMQSDLKNTMQNILIDLNNGKTVLFSGTPCQVDAVKRFIEQKRKSLDNLVLCDFVCHGASSPAVWKDYVEFLNETAGQLQYYNFRGKEGGWAKYFPEIVINDKKVSNVYKEKNSYFCLYKRAIIMRPSCYACRYASYNRQSDITCADFWNIEKAIPEMNDDKGTSQVLVNTSIGQLWFERAKEMLRYQGCSKEDVWQPHLEYPMKQPKEREKFWNAYHTQPFPQVIKTYGKTPLPIKCRHAVMPIINKLGLYVLAGKLYRLVFVHDKKK